MNFSVREDTWLDFSAPWQTEVGTVFSTSFDARLFGSFIFFPSKDYDLHPFGMLVPLRFSQPDPGERIEWDGNRLFIGSSSFQRGPDIQQTKIPKGSDFPYLDENLRTLKRSLPLLAGESPLSAAFQDISANEFTSPIRQVRSGLGAGSLDLSAFGGWFGAGVGLTPSWDDFMTGLLLGDRWSGADSVSITERLFDFIRPRTTIQAFWQLKFAAAGKASLKWENFLCRFIYERTNTREILEMGKFGHSSGAEILCGIAARLEACQKKRARPPSRHAK